MAAVVATDKSLDRRESDSASRVSDVEVRLRVSVTWSKRVIEGGGISVWDRALAGLLSLSRLKTYSHIFTIHSCQPLLPTSLSLSQLASREKNDRNG